VESSLAWESGIAGRESLSEPEAESRSWAGEKTPVESVRRGRSQLSTTLISGI